MSDQKLQAYWDKVLGETPIEDHLNVAADQLLNAFETQRKKRSYVPPYARAKLSCKFHNNGRRKGHKDFFSYDYDPREDLHNYDPARVMDEGRGIRELLELATDWNNGGYIEVATLWINLTLITWTGCKEYNMALGRWGTGLDTVVRDYKLIPGDRSERVIKPVPAMQGDLLDLDYLATMYQDNPKLKRVQTWT